MKKTTLQDFRNWLMDKHDGSIHAKELEVLESVYREFTQVLKTYGEPINGKPEITNRMKIE